ncbi:MAG: hypothetical protein B6D78_08050 [gamma proteobacterium symbiont of Ctena orbiculata]|nr:MAG: hypothetical protein B6D78_08050 [gamma proteobacterium symbiont of Ctena orbiculata]
MWLPTLFPPPVTSATASNSPAVGKVPDVDLYLESLESNNITGTKFLIIRQHVYPNLKSSTLPVQAIPRGNFHLAM